MSRLLIKLVVVFCCFGVLTTLASATEDIWVSLDGTTGPNQPTATVLESTEYETIIEFKLSGFQFEELTESGAAYKKLRLPGQATTMEIGKPQMPVIRELVAIPGDKNVSLEVVSVSEIGLEGYNVYPFQRPVFEGQPRPGFNLDEQFYRQSQLYPLTKAEISTPAIWRDQRVVTVQVNPVQVNPATGKLVVCTGIIVKLSYSGHSDTNVKQDRAEMITPEYDRAYRRNIVNYDFVDVNQSMTSLDAGYDYLIIAADEYVDNLTPFLNWKATQGLTTKVTPVSQIGGDVASIKNYITNEYVSSSIRYVLFVGDESDIPCYSEYVDWMGIHSFYSDYYYTLLAGDDDFAEIAIGRFSVSSEIELDRMISKSVTYESNPPREDWLQRALLVAHREEAPAKYQACKEAIRTASFLPRKTYDVLYPEFTTAYGALEASGGDEATNADVITAINTGQRAINYRGHGLEGLWADWNVAGENFTTADVALLDNGEMTPVIFGIACLNNDLSYEDVCLGEAFTRATSGAVAYLGASSPSWTVANEDYDRQIWALVYDEGLNTVGDVSNQAAVEIITLHGDYGIDNARMFLWLGDPALNVIYDGYMGPDAPLLVSPDDGAFLDPPAQPVLDWSDVANAAYYLVVIDNDRDFSSPVGEQSNLASSDWTAPALTAGTYYWRVRSVDADGISGFWSDTRTLYVGTDSPSLIWPADGVTVDNEDSLAFEWLALSGATGYTIQFSSSTDFESPLVESSSDYCESDHCFSYLSPPLPRGTYYWRVKGADDGWPWSEVQQFKLRGDATTSGDVVMHVEHVEVTRIYTTNNRLLGLGTITIHDADGNPVAAAEVTCDYNFETFVTGTRSELTDGDGIAVITTNPSQSPMGEWCFTVTNVEKAGAVYSPEDNLVTQACETGPVYRFGNLAEGEVPDEFSLGQNYPNPFNPSTEITFGLPHSAHVRLEIFNILGEKVEDLIDGPMDAGHHCVIWDGGNMASGIYLYRIETGEQSISKKMLLIK